MNGTPMRVSAEDVQDGDFLPGLDNGYVIEVETGNGYLSYPRSGYGQSGAMPEDTIIITFNDCDGGENYLLLGPDVPVNIERP